MVEIEISGVVIGGTSVNNFISRAWPCVNSAEGHILKWFDSCFSDVIKK